jgi:hypothetical protein
MNTRRRASRSKKSSEEETDAIHAAKKASERPVKPHTIDRRAEAKRATHDAVSRPSKPHHLERADKGPRKGLAELPGLIAE